MNYLYYAYYVYYVYYVYYMSYVFRMRRKLEPNPGKKNGRPMWEPQENRMGLALQAMQAVLIRKAPSLCCYVLKAARERALRTGQQEWAAAYLTDPRRFSHFCLVSEIINFQEKWIWIYEWWSDNCKGLVESIPMQNVSIIYSQQNHLSAEHVAV